MPHHWVTLLGCGHMGGAMVKGWHQHQLPLHISVIKPTPMTEHPIDFDARSFSEVAQNHKPDVVILAVPPQIADQAMDGIEAIIQPETLVISIMAGKTLRQLETALSGHQHIVRAMPNMPSAIGQGICGYVSSHPLIPEHQGLLHQLLSATGAVVALDQENEINIVTAVSGSGPAYGFLLIKAMQDAAVSLGLAPEKAALLALHTVAGAGQYALNNTTDAEGLLNKIAIKGGTTEAAIRHLRTDQAFESLMGEAIKKAYLRAIDLSE